MRALILFVMSVGLAHAAPVKLTHQVRLLDQVGNPVSGDIDVRVTLWSHPSSTSLSERLWTFEYPSLAVADGYFSTTLDVGDGSVAVDSEWFADDVWIGVSVNSAPELAPRSPVRDVPRSGFSATTASLTAIPSPLTLTCTSAGATQWDTDHNRFLVCNGTVWLEASLTPITYAGPVRRIVAVGSSREWSDGSVARSCEGYRRPGVGFDYIGLIGDGQYDIDPDGDGSTWSRMTVYCDQTHHEGGWTLALAAGLGRDLTAAGVEGDFQPYASSASAPASGALHKMSDTLINAVKTATGSQIGYWVTTPGAGTGLLGAENFHRADCTFQMRQLESAVRATTCDEWTITYSGTSPSWAAGGHWHPNSAAYAWAFGYGRSETLGTHLSCFNDGSGLGVHGSPYSPFHRGWCASADWGQVWVR